MIALAGKERTKNISNNEKNCGDQTVAPCIMRFGTSSNIADEDISAERKAATVFEACFTMQTFVYK